MPFESYFIQKRCLLKVTLLCVITVQNTRSHYQVLVINNACLQVTCNIASSIRSCVYRKHLNTILSKSSSYVFIHICKNVPWEPFRKLFKPCIELLKNTAVMGRGRQIFFVAAALASCNGMGQLSSVFIGIGVVVIVSVNNVKTAISSISQTPTL